MTSQEFLDSLAAVSDTAVARFNALPSETQSVILAAADSIGGEWPDFVMLFNTDPSWRAFMAMPLMQQMAYVMQQLTGGKPAAVLQITDGTLTPDRSYVVVDAEESAPADVLDTIATTLTNDGMELKLVAQDSRTITVKHNPDAANGIALADGMDKVLSATLFLHLKRFGDRWRETPTGSAGDATARAAASQAAAAAAAASSAAATALSTANAAQETADAATPAAVFATSQQILLVRDEKPNGTAGGTFTASGWRQRDLNTVVANTIPGAALSSNQVTLPAGIYDVYGRATARSVGNHKAALMDAASSIVILGSNEWISSSDNVMTSSIVEGRITLSAETILKLVHWGNVTTANTGFGNASSMDDGQPCVYSSLAFRRVS